MNYCIQCRHEVRSQPLLNTEQLTQHTFTIMRCNQCGLGWTAVPQDIDLSPYYPEEYYGFRNRRFHPLIEWLISFFRRARAWMIMRKVPTGRILDIGCGRGLMLQELKQGGWDCYGTEYSEKAAQSTGEALKIPVYVTTDIVSCRFPEHYFDVVSLWHVFEHLSKPQEILQEIHRVLKPQGLLIIEVPNFSSLQAKMAKGKWIHLDSPRHFFHYSIHNLKKILEANGFNVQSTRTLSLEFGPFGMLQSLLNLFFPRQDFIYFLMKNREDKLSHLKTGASLGKLAVLFLVLSPFIFISMLLEFGAACFGRGGVLRVIAKNV